MIRKNDPHDAIERIAKGYFIDAPFLGLALSMTSIITMHCVGNFLCVSEAVVFAGLRSRIDVGVISGGSGESHYFVNVADVHL